MSDEIVFYHWPQSRGRMVHWMLEEVGAPYRVALTNLEKGEHKQPDFLSVNPMGKIPAIVHKGTVVTETAAIITYLADEFPAAGLAPPVGAAQRGAYLRWMFYGASCIDGALIDRMLARPAPERVGAVSYGKYEDVIEVLDQAVSGSPYLLGDKFSAADLYVGSQIGFGVMTKAVEPRPSFQAYIERVTSRPASRRAMEQGESLMAKAKAAG
jgi:glutathione S-transferase